MPIQLFDLTRDFANKNAVNHINLLVDGGFACVTGRSGSGKSTLIKMIGLMLRPTSGKILINDIDVWACTESERNKYRNSLLGFIFQDYSLEPSYTVFENIELPLLIAGMSKAERKHRVDECLEFIGMTGAAKQKAATLSGGEQQRTAIARAIANNPSFILADEPCGNLDKENSDKVISLFRSLSDKGVTVIMVTHNEEDARKTDRIIRLLDGRILCDEKI